MKNKYLRIFFGIISTIFLGAIGSGIWEKFLSPFSSSTTSYLISLFSNISSSYANSLYENIGKGSVGVIGLLIIYPYSIIQCFMMIVPIIAIILATVLFIKINRLQAKENIEKEEKNKSEDKIKKNDIPNSIINYEKKFKRLKLSLIITYPLSFGLFFWILSHTVRDAYSYDVVIYIERSLDIISPKISEQKLKELKSEYRQIDNKEKFNNFNKKLIELSQTNNFELPEISILEVK